MKASGLSTLVRHTDLEVELKDRVISGKKEITHLSLICWALYWAGYLDQHLMRYK